MGHKCKSPNCKRRTGERCDTCRVGGGARLVMLDANGKPVKPAGKRHATPHEKGAAVDMYFDGLSYRRIARNMEQYFGKETGATSIYRWVRELSGTADEILRPMKVDTGREWVADEMMVNVGGEKMWLFNVMDSDTRFVLAAYLTPERTARAAQTALAMARDKSNNAPAVVKTDGLRSYRQALPRAFPTRPVKHTVSQGIKAQINNNMSERLQGTFRDRDKTLRGLEGRDTGQAYVDGLVLHYNYFRPHESLDGKRPAEAAGAELPFEDWGDVAAIGDKGGQGMINFPAPPPGGYATIVVDPPWPSQRHQNYQKHTGVYGNYPIESRYSLMPLPEIKSLPVMKIAAEQNKLDQAAHGINQGHNPGIQPAATPPDGLGDPGLVAGASPFGAPAPC